ncbi:MAG TPA: uroporphyrinogen-III synthase [Steroidobacteraceae bacterium]|nr:uroporphyrinogen-III synthase [Steroidobacteraceae bacterium]
MASKTVAILETRTGAHLAELIARCGALPMHAPALEEIPDVDPGALGALLEEWSVQPFHLAIFQTGVGTRALFQATDALGSTPKLERLLEAAIIVVRGPKPTGELGARGVRIDIRAASPFTTEAVLAAIASIGLAGRRVLVQRYGETNRRLRESLEARGAAVREIATYRWALPRDIAPLERMIEALAASSLDAVVFTSAVQVQNLFAVAAGMGRAADLPRLLNRGIVASIGPVCSRALRERGIAPTFEADPPKLGPLVAGLKRALAG